MTRTGDLEPWRALPASVADLIEPELDAITAEILATIARDVPQYARPLEGRFGHGIRTGVGEALRQFVALVRDPEAGRERSRDVYVELGRGEQEQGRTLDSLQAAYRVGARVAWRQVAAAGRRAGLEAEPLSLLAEAIFAYIDELAADSVEGYAAAQAQAEDARRRRRQDLVQLLVRERSVEPPDLAAAAAAAEWRLPAEAAALACAETELAAIARRLPPEALTGVIDETGCIVLADPEGPGRQGALESAAGGSVLALGPTTEPLGLGESWALAESLLRASRAAPAPAGGLLRAEDHLAELILQDAAALTSRIAARRLASLAGLTEKARARMEETALAYVRHNGNAVAMAAELHIHPQTARYRISRLKELLGDQLDDPDARFELQLALRAARV
ncbi:MAG TPA: helix-turn-helix domain-containing protein [Solirubrobacterales bacterium]|nr:helix-turn-helix domain-containing protein [Solirubrobacterales bacterium]